MTFKFKLIYYLDGVSVTREDVFGIYVVVSLRHYDVAPNLSTLEKIYFVKLFFIYLLNLIN
jgi:hypothetical protein